MAILNHEICEHLRARLYELYPVGDVRAMFDLYHQKAKEKPELEKFVVAAVTAKPDQLDVSFLACVLFMDEHADEFARLQLSNSALAAGNLSTKVN